jgi:DNA-binding beta-propeller fold protein YncE
MIHTLKCPACSAPLDYDDDNGGPTCVCPFCANTVVVPESLRPRREPQVVVSTFSYQAGRPRRGGAGVGVVLAVVGVILAVVVGVIFAVASFVSGVATSVATTDISPPPRSSLAPPDFPKLPGAKPPAAPSFAPVLLEFGSEGIGPGMFKDTRSVAVDGDGYIYAGEYTGGRVQVFDPSGKFVTQWTADPKMPLRALAADRKGTVYVAQSGKIQRYEGRTGRALGPVEYAGGDGFDDVIATPDGGLVAVWDRHTDDIVKFDSAGRVTRVIRKAISGQTDSSELNMRVAADGEGYIYALGTFNDAVMKYSPDGRFLTRFGGRGEEPGLFRAAHAVAADGHGRVYVSDSKGVQVFDSNGRYLAVFKPAPVSFGLLFNDRNELFVAARTKIVKCAPRWRSDE